MDDRLGLGSMHFGWMIVLALATGETCWQLDDLIFDASNDRFILGSQPKFDAKWISMDNRLGSVAQADGWWTSGIW